MLSTDSILSLRQIRAAPHAPAHGSKTNRRFRAAARNHRLAGGRGGQHRPSAREPPARRGPGCLAAALRDQERSGRLQGERPRQPQRLLRERRAGEFLLHEAEAAASSAGVEFVEDPLTTRPWTRAGGQPAVPEKLDPRDWSTLLKISAALSSLRELDDLQRRLLELIFEVIPAERGAILLAGTGGEEFASIFGWDRLPGTERPVKVSRAVIRRVLEERLALLNHEVPEAGTTSIPCLTSVLAVPLLAFDRAVGAIYLDTSNPQVRFEEGHRQLLTGIAGIATVALEQARQREWLESENQRLQEQAESGHDMVGESDAMRAVRQFIAKVAPQPSTVLICGETGTGKELVAHAIHRASPRADKPFIAINCAALPEALLESELFGHEKGAFTGALARKPGKLEVAEGGTVFLDEVSELALPLQAKFLRVLQEREFERVGGTRSIKVDIRLIAATNRELEEAVSDGSFRRDLYFRLNVLSLTTPPLRQRREDISLLASYFVAKHSKRCTARGVTGA
ncbi:MAG: sigma-54-dependent Fis family transcriptional regulator [Acidobacteria bacterium]|nr:MAG: sigma-54-dependent Fis family transcriptional regulator [Acidobacteriota bacterium]